MPLQDQKVYSIIYLHIERDAELSHGFFFHQTTCHLERNCKVADSATCTKRRCDQGRLERAYR